ncbi:MAG: hypothetical protein V3T03_02580 [Candidatus Bipolaricaulota bacterium]
MKRALSIAAVTALSLLVFLFAGYAQEEGATSVAELLDKELTVMESAFGSLEAFMAELIGEVKGNMGDIDDLNAKVGDLRDIVTAISVEIKTVEGKLVGLRADVDALGETQQELKVRIVALEAGLSELATFVDAMSARLAITDADLGMLREEFDALIADYDVFKEAFVAFQVSVYGDIDSLRDSFSADISLLSITTDDLSLRVQSLEDEDVGTFKKKVIDLERSFAALAIRVDNNRAKLEGFDHAIASLSDEMMATRESVLAANQEMLNEYDARLLALESVDLQPQIDTLYFISIVALLAGMGALIWGFLGN